jgi:hypothetical protein
VIKQSTYLASLKERRAKSGSRVTTRHQMIGLIIAGLLEDAEHKSLYIKLAKEGDQNLLMEIARDVSERGPVQNKGAYFMTILEARDLLPKAKPKKAAKKQPARRAKRTATPKKKRAKATQRSR